MDRYSRFQDGMGKRDVTPFGLYGANGEMPSPLFLRGVDCRFHLTGDLASVHIAQLYFSQFKEPTHCVYSFPVPLNASVYQCDIEINGRLFQARVEEREKAVSDTERRKLRGYRTFMVQKPLSNLFRLELGNVQPNDRILVLVSYFQTIQRLQDTCTLRIPFSPAYRYSFSHNLDLDNIQDCDRGSEGGIRGELIESEVDSLKNKPDAGATVPRDVPLFVQGNIEDKCGTVSDVRTLQHPLRIVGPGLVPSLQQESYAGSVGCDWVLQWSNRIPERLFGAVWRYREAETDYALVRFSVPLPDLENDHTLEPLNGRNLQYFLLLDASGSMAGIKWARAVGAAKEFIGQLGEQDRVRLGWFNTIFREIGDDELLMTKSRLVQHPQYDELERITPEGGTEMFRAIRQVLSRGTAPMGEMIMILISDGGVAHEFDIVSYFENFPHVVVHCLGIEVNQNEALFEPLARQQNGFYHQCTPAEDVPSVAKRLSGFTQGRVVSRIQASPGWEFARPVPNKIYAGQTCSLLLKRSGPESSAEALRIQFTRANGRTDELSLTEGGQGSMAIARLWSREHIHWLIHQGNSSQAIDESIASNIICDLTAFVAWDDSEKVKLARKLWYEPSLPPETTSSSIIYWRLNPVGRCDEHFLHDIAPPPLEGQGLGGVQVPSGYEAHSNIMCFDQVGFESSNVERLLKLMEAWKWPAPFRFVELQWIQIQRICIDIVTTASADRVEVVNRRMLPFLNKLAAVASGSANHVEKELQLLRFVTGPLGQSLQAFVDGFIKSLKSMNEQLTKGRLAQEFAHSQRNLDSPSADVLPG